MLNSEQIIELYNQGKYDELIKLVNDILKEEPKNKDILFFLARIYFMQSKLKDSEKAIDRIIKIEPKNANANYHKAMILFILQRPEQAFFHSETALAETKNPPFDFVILHAGILHKLNDPLYKKWIKKANAIDLVRTKEFMKNQWIKD